MSRWYDEIFRGASTANILDVRPGLEKERLFRQKREVWTQFGYSDDYLEKMKVQAFWDAEYTKVGDVDAGVAASRRLPEP
jgi:hypothetical protein